MARHNFAYKLKLFRNMKKALFTLFFITLSLFSNAAMDEIVLTKDGVVRDRFDFPVPIDMPDLYYDSNTQEIIIDGGGEVNYYDVEIASVSAWTVVISTQVSGTYGTIDVSSLPEGEYCITIDSPTGNSYEGFFDTY
jgi:hypothetical protein